MVLLEQERAERKLKTPRGPSRRAVIGGFFAGLGLIALGAWEKLWREPTDKLEAFAETKPSQLPFSESRTRIVDLSTDQIQSMMLLQAGDSLSRGYLEKEPDLPAPIGIFAEFAINKSQPLTNMLGNTPNWIEIETAQVGEPITDIIQDITIMNPVTLNGTYNLDRPITSDSHISLILSAGGNDAINNALEYKDPNKFVDNFDTFLQRFKRNYTTMLKQVIFAKQRSNAPLNIENLVILGLTDGSKFGKAVDDSDSRNPIHFDPDSIPHLRAALGTVTRRMNCAILEVLNELESDLAVAGIQSIFLDLEHVPVEGIHPSVTGYEMLSKQLLSRMSYQGQRLSDLANA